jgi:hypothetical protein
MAGKEVVLMKTSSHAIFSADRKYRYRLTRWWYDGGPILCFCLLNASNANENRNDPTVHRCIGFGHCPRKGVTVPAPTTPEQTVVETVKRKSIDNADVKNVFGGLKERRGYNSPKAGAEAVAVRWMLKQGYSVPDILWTYDAMKQLAWWKDKFLNMQSVKQQIGEMLKKRIKS